MATQVQTVLVADGDRGCADSLAQLLNRHGVEASSTYDGLEAIHLAQRMRPQNVIMDVELPGTSGFEVASELRTAFARAIRLVAYTGHPLTVDRRRVRESGFDEWVPKTTPVLDLLRATSPALHETVLRSIAVNVRQMRNQLTLASSLLTHVESTRDAAMRRRLHDFLASRIEGVVASMSRLLPAGAPERAELWAEAEAMRERLERFFA
ncbi:MAG TPA: response regulator [Usitatibacter sp.]|nr:response regulator [Usitatibacter sp.]